MSRQNVSLTRIEQMRALAEIGSSLCCYLPGAGNPDEWPHARCDCKYLPVGHELGRTLSGSEQTGCCEVRAAWLALDTLRERADEIARAADV
jgi:hypothetical protein